MVRSPIKDPESFCAVCSLTVKCENLVKGIIISDLTK